MPNPDLGLPGLEGRPWYDDLLLETELRDLESFVTMPAAVRAEHARLVTELAGDPSFRPCAWLDPETNRCKHYEFRPIVCRVWEPGGRGCNAARLRGQKVVWRDAADMRPDDWWNPRDRDPDRPDHVSGWWDSDPARWPDLLDLAKCAAAVAGLLGAWHAVTGG